MKLKNYFVYIMMNKANTALYIGMTNDLESRFYQHVHGLTPGFTTKYKLKKLVYYDTCDYAEQAIAREKQLKNWHRDWKLNLIRQTNPMFEDLSIQLFQIPKQVRNDEIKVELR